MLPVQKIFSADSMVSAIRNYGIIPFFHGKIKAWSVEEITAPGYWFTSSEELGPWDWKIDAVREGDIAYGKFIGGKAAFATVEYYRHLMNWRRSLPEYRLCLGENGPAATQSGKLMKHLSPAALNVIRKQGECSMREIKDAVSEAVTPAFLKIFGENYVKNISPTVRKSVVDTIVQYLEMGTWTIIGDFERVYKGPNLEYHGWQRSSHTTPDLLFGKEAEERASGPFWAKMFSDDKPGAQAPFLTDCTPEESLEFLIDRIEDVTSCRDRDAIRKIIR